MCYKNNLCMDSKDTQKLVDSIKAFSKNIEKLTTMIDKQNQRLNDIVSVIKNLNISLKGNPNA